MGDRGSPGERLQAGRAIHAQHPCRCAAVLQAIGFSGEPRRDDAPILNVRWLTQIRLCLRLLRKKFHESFRLTRNKPISMAKLFRRNDSRHHDVWEAWGSYMKL